MIASLGKNWDNRDKSRVLTIGFHALLLLLALWPFLNVTQWTEEKGVMVEFSEIIVNEPQTQKSVTSNSSRPSPKSILPLASAPEASEKETKTTVDQAESVVQEVSEVTKAPVAIKETKDSQANKPVERKRNFSNLFGASSTTSKDKDPGSPDVHELEGLSAVTSTEVGEGLDGRQIVFAPDIEDNSQRVGRVVVRICVDKNGRVISSEYTQRGSSTTDRYLVDKAVEAAWKWRFSTSELAKQCGMITIDFELK